MIIDYRNSLAILNNGKVRRPVDVYNPQAIENNTRLDRVMRFQDFVNTMPPEESKKEFVRLSRMICDVCLDDNRTYLYDYDNMIFIEDTRFGANTVELHPGINLSDIWICVPCFMSNTHKGINCRLVDHLVQGTECVDCAKLFGDAGLFPSE